MNHLLSFLIETNTQKVFDFLALNPGREFIEKEIQKGSGATIFRPRVVCGQWAFLGLCFLRGKYLFKLWFDLKTKFSK